jgi:hypothetical protein
VDHLIVVALVLAIATFATGVVLPLAARRHAGGIDDPVARDELAAWRRRDRAAER